MKFGYITVSVLSEKDIALFSVRNSGVLSVCSNDKKCDPVTITRLSPSQRISVPVTVHLIIRRMYNSLSINTVFAFKMRKQTFPK